MSRFLLDTNLLLGFTREAPWAIRAREDFNLGDPETMVFTSAICQGEILALAEKNGWGREKRSRLEEVLNGVPTLDIGRGTILDAYARIDAWTHGKAVTSPKNAPPPKPAVSMNQNDLWIAATAHVSGLHSCRQIPTSNIWTISGWNSSILTRMSHRRAPAASRIAALTRPRSAARAGAAEAPAARRAPRGRARASRRAASPLRAAPSRPPASGSPARRRSGGRRWCR